MAWRPAARVVEALDVDVFKSQNNLTSTELHRRAVTHWSPEACNSWLVSRKLTAFSRRDTNCLLTERHRVCLVLFFFSSGTVSPPAHRWVRFSARITQKHPRLVAAGPGQKVERPSIDNFPSELGSLHHRYAHVAGAFSSHHPLFILAAALRNYLQFWQVWPKCF